MVEAADGGVHSLKTEPAEAKRGEFDGGVISDNALCKHLSGYQSRPGIVRLTL